MASDLDAVLRVRLLQIFHQRGWTVTEAARELKVAQPIIHRYLTGERYSIRLTTLTRICAGLGITAAELFAERSSPSFKATQLTLMRAKLRLIRELAAEEE